MRTKLTVFVSAVFVTVVLAVYGQTQGQQTGVPAPEGAATQRAVLDKYCIRCHNQRAKNGITLDTLDLAHIGEKAEQWEKAVRKLRGGMMPPSGEARPDAATLEALTSWLENELDRNSVRQLPPPGLHRLNRTEYTNVVRDLLALEVDATKFLPPDDSTRGFDNMAAALNLSPALVEAYLSAAGKISRLAVGDVKNPTQTVYRVPGDNTQNYHVEGLPFGTRGGIVIQHEFPADGEYAIKVVPVNRGLMGGSQAFGEVRGEKLEVLLDGERLGLFDWDKGVTSVAGSGQPGTIDLRFKAKAGLHAIGVTFLATHLRPDSRLERSIPPKHDRDGRLARLHLLSACRQRSRRWPLSRRRLLRTPPAGERSSYAIRPSPGRRKLLRATYRFNAGAPRISSASGCGRHGKAHHAVSVGAQGRWTSTTASNWRCRAFWPIRNLFIAIEAEPASFAGDQPIASAISSWLRDLSFFLWSTSPDDELTHSGQPGQAQRPACFSSSKSAACWPIRVRKRLHLILPGNG